MAVHCPHESNCQYLIKMCLSPRASCRIVQLDTFRSQLVHQGIFHNDDRSTRVTRRAWWTVTERVHFHRARVGRSSTAQPQCWKAIHDRTMRKKKNINKRRMWYVIPISSRTKAAPGDTRGRWSALNFQSSRERGPIMSPMWTETYVPSSREICRSVLLPLVMAKVRASPTSPSCNMCRAQCWKLSFMPTTIRCPDRLTLAPSVQF